MATNEWIENVTYKPPVGDGVAIDVIIDGQSPHPYFDTINTTASEWIWEKLDKDCITHWRLHQEEKPQSWGIDAAWDDIATTGPVKPLKYPETTYTVPSTVKEKSLEDKVAEMFNIVYGKDFTLEASHVSTIIDLINLIKTKGS